MSLESTLVIVGCIAAYFLFQIGFLVYQMVRYERQKRNRRKASLDK